MYDNAKLVVRICIWTRVPVRLRVRVTHVSSPEERLTIVAGITVILIITEVVADHWR